MNLPNKLTVLRIIMVPFFVAIFLIDSLPYNKLIATCIFALASITDMVDGYIARRYNLTTDFGKFLDPIADKILVNAAIVVLVFDSSRLTDNWGYIGLVLLIVALVFISREMVVSGFRLVASSRGIVLAADKLGKVKTITQMIGLIIVLPQGSFVESAPSIVWDIVVGGTAVLVLSAIVSVISCINYMIKNKNVLVGST